MGLCFAELSHLERRNLFAAIVCEQLVREVGANKVVQNS